MRSRTQRSNHKLVPIFGEDGNDTRAIREFVLAMFPDFPGKVKPLLRPPVYSKDANPSSIRSHVASICDVIRSEMATSEVACVLVHRDCDAVEPAHEAASEEIETTFRARGFDVTAVTPAWELEAWLFLWPQAVASYRPTWNSLHHFRGRNVGLIHNAKEEFRRAVRPPRPYSGRDYRESDALGIARKVRELGIINAPQANSASFTQFQRSLTATI